MMSLDGYKAMCFNSLNKLRTPQGYFRASLGKHYVNYTWWRDNFYCSLPYLQNYPELYRQGYHTYLDTFIRYEKELKKFSSMIENPHTDVPFHYIHPRVNIDGSEIWDQEWGYMQNDAVCYILIGIYLGEKAGLGIIRDDTDRWIIQLTIDYLKAIRFWETPDSGTWEENVELRSSSIGVCMKAFEYMGELGFDLGFGCIDKARVSLYSLLPYSTPTRFCDLDLLFLPYLNIVGGSMADYILANTHLMLERPHGIIRYVGDRYYSSDYGNLVGNEAQWVFGFAYLSCIYYDKGDTDKSKYYLDKIMNTWRDGDVPELVYANSSLTSAIANDNKPLGWTCAMTIMAIDKHIGR